MSRVRVLVGTRKGAFVLTSDGKRTSWDVSRPALRGLGDLPPEGVARGPEPDLRVAVELWFGQVIQRSDDGGATWEPVGNEFAYDGVPGTHQWYDGTPHPWEFARVWHLEPSRTDPDSVYAGVEDAALFRSGDGGKTWHELAGLRGHGSGPDWQPGAGGMCLHTILRRPDAIPRGSSSRSRRRARSAPTTRARPGARSTAASSPSRSPTRPPRSATACTGSRMHPARPNVLFMQKHWDVMRSDDAGDSWHEVSGNLPSDFGFPIDVHAHEPDTIYVVPIKSDSEHYPPEGKLRVYRSRSGGNEWEALTNGLPQTRLLRERAARRDGGRLARPVRRVLRHDAAARCTRPRTPATTGAPIVRDLPAVLSVEVQTLPMIRVVLPPHLRTLARVGGEVKLDVAEPVTQRARSTRSRRAIRCCAARSAITPRRSGARSCASSPAREDLSHESPDAPLPDAVACGAEPFVILGALAGG